MSFFLSFFLDAMQGGSGTEFVSFLSSLLLLVGFFSSWSAGGGQVRCFVAGM
jgi:hypothetical protein